MRQLSGQKYDCKINYINDEFITNVYKINRLRPLKNSSNMRCLRRPNDGIYQ